MKSLVKYFGLILLIVFTSVWTSNGEDIELQDAMPQEILANSVNHSEKRDSDIFPFVLSK